MRRSIVQDQALIRLQAVSRVFETEAVITRALWEIDLEIAKGEFLGILGPSGSGKSTLLAILGLLDSPSAGRYWIAGDPVEQLGAAERTRTRRERIGFIFQSFNLIGGLSVQENVELPLRYRRISAAERKRRAAEALERVGMSHRARHMPAQLSGGQQQRVAVARAVAGEPLLLLADEPTGNLDSESGEQVMKLIEELHVSGATVCMVTHDTRYLQRTQRSVHLTDGQIVDPSMTTSAVSS
jgi:putative ABC transport system ATP-binding protein